MDKMRLSVPEPVKVARAEILDLAALDTMYYSRFPMSFGPQEAAIVWGYHIYLSTIYGTSAFMAGFLYKSEGRPTTIDIEDDNVIAHEFADFHYASGVGFAEPSKTFMRILPYPVFVIRPLYLGSFCMVNIGGDCYGLIYYTKIKVPDKDWNALLVKDHA